MSIQKVFKFHIPEGAVILTDKERQSMDQILADLIYKQNYEELHLENIKEGRGTFLNEVENKCTKS